jgi:hypothetical protein
VGGGGCDAYIYPDAATAVRGAARVRARGEGIEHSRENALRAGFTKLLQYQRKAPCRLLGGGVVIAQDPPAGESVLRPAVVKAGRLYG